MRFKFRVTRHEARPHSSTSTHARTRTHREPPHGHSLGSAAIRLTSANHHPSSPPLFGSILSRRPYVSQPRALQFLGPNGDASQRLRGFAECRYRLKIKPTPKPSSFKRNRERIKTTQQTEAMRNDYSSSCSAQSRDLRRSCCGTGADQTGRHKNTPSSHFYATLISLP